jgi:hypothetical protein
MTLLRLSDLAQDEALATGAVLASPHHSAAALTKAQARVRTLQGQLDATRHQLTEALKELDEVAPRWTPLADIGIDLATVSEANARSHHHAKAARARRQREAMSLALYQLGRQPAELLARGRLRVTFTRLASGTLDDDNLAGAFKACRDAVASWLGVDDGPRGPVVWAYAQEPHKRHRNAPMVRVSFEEPAPRRTP